MSGISDWTNDIHQGDARETLADLPDSSVHMMMTSPPYFGLRDYGVDGQIGLEESLDEYIAELVDVFREVRRVLRPDGSAWLNLGDSYAGSGGAGGQWNSEESGDVEYAGDRGESYNGPLNGSGFGRKNKMLVPHRVAIALQDDGWIVRNDVTWVKPNPMPSSVKDRLNTTTEQVFHLTPDPDYWYDLDAIRGPYSESMKRRAEAGYQHKHGDAADGWGEGDHNHSANHNIGGITDESGEYGDHMNPAGKNPGDVFEVTTKPFPDAHFAVYPPELVEKPIKATCPPKVCVECGSPYEREVEEERPEIPNSGKVWDESAQQYRSVEELQRNDDKNTGGETMRNGSPHSTLPPEREFKGWQQTCDCDTDATEPGIALDPFAGAGTTCLVAKDHGRRFVGIDLNAEYVAMAQQRLGLTVKNPEHVRDAAEVGLDAFTSDD